jgi:hypothetical protein
MNHCQAFFAAMIYESRRAGFGWRSASRTTRILWINPLWGASGKRSLLRRFSFHPALSPYSRPRDCFNEHRMQWLEPACRPSSGRRADR